MATGSALDKKDEIYSLLFQRPFDEKYPFVLGKLIGPVEVVSCNGVTPTPFSNARFNLKYHGAGFLCGLLRVQWLWLYRVLAGDVEDEDGTAKSLIEYLCNAKHIKCLKLLKDIKREPYIQAILATHLFGPLAGKGCIIDKNRLCKELEKCPGCDEKVQLGDTPFGNKDTWYGSADIIVNRCTVSVERSIYCENQNDNNILEEENVDIPEGNDEPAKKRLRPSNSEINNSETSRDVSNNDIGDVSNSDCDETEFDDRRLSENITEVKPTLKNPFYKVLAQTISNAFLQVKKSQEFANTFIPSFLATEKFIKIQMYCYSKDLLFVSQELSLFETETDEIDISTVIFLWLTLNTEIPAQNLGLMEHKPCKFKDFVKKFDKYSCYTDGITQPLNLCETDEKYGLELSPLYNFPDFDKYLFKAMQIYETAVEKQNCPL